MVGDVLPVYPFLIKYGIGVIGSSYAKVFKNVSVSLGVAATLGFGEGGLESFDAELY